MTIQKLDHNGNFSLFDLGGLRDQFDDWCEIEDVNSIRPASRIPSNALIEGGDRDVTLGNALLSLRPNKVHLTRWKPCDRAASASAGPVGRH